MFDHLSLGVPDPAVSKAFYDAALKPLGIVVVDEFADAAHGYQGYAYGYDPRAFEFSDPRALQSGRPYFWIGGPRPASRPVHIAFSARTVAEVDAFYAAAMAAEGPGSWRAGRAGALPSRLLRRLRARQGRQQHRSGLPHHPPQSVHVSQPLEPRLGAAAGPRAWAGLADAEPAVLPDHRRQFHRAGRRVAGHGGEPALELDLGRARLHHPRRRLWSGELRAGGADPARRRARHPGVRRGADGDGLRLLFDGRGAAALLDRGGADRRRLRARRHHSRHLRPFPQLPARQPRVRDLFHLRRPRRRGRAAALFGAARDGVGLAGLLDRVRGLGGVGRD